MLTLNVIKAPVDQTWTVERIAAEAPPITWEKVFEDAKAELHDISTILDEQERTYGQYYPLKRDIFNAFNYTPLNQVKVVILGQDPYHQTINVGGAAVPRAVGLSFSVRREDAIPSSLQNIYTEIANTVRGFAKPDHGDLREWARQGVLLLNPCLTVRPGMAGSHGDIWLGFINKVFKAIAAVNPNCVFLLWGREAQKVKTMLGDRSVVLEAAHPSGLSARRGFFGCNHFNLANDALIRQGKVGINWRISSIAELNAVPRAAAPIAPAVAIGHQPILTPVNVSMLPTIIPLKPTITAGVPTILGVPAVQLPHQKSPPVVPLLPTIPNTKAASPGTHPSLPVLKPGTPQVEPLPVTPTVPTAATPPRAPIIPKIQFGHVLNAQPAINIGVPQIVQPLPVMPTLTKVVQSVQTPIVGLPIIPALVY